MKLFNNQQPKLYVVPRKDEMLSFQNLLKNVEK